MKFRVSRAISTFVVVGLFLIFIIVGGALVFVALANPPTRHTDPNIWSPVSTSAVQIQGQLVSNGNTSSGVLNFYTTGSIALSAGSSNVLFATASGSCATVSSPAVPAGSSESVTFSWYLLAYSGGQGVCLSVASGKTHMLQRLDESNARAGSPPSRREDVTC